MERLLEDPRVRELIASRRRRYVVLSACVSALYLAVAIGCAFAPALMGTPVPGTGVSLGIASMAAIIIVGIACSGYYTWWSNTVRDPQIDEIRAGLDVVREVSRTQHDRTQTERAQTERAAAGSGGGRQA